MCYGLSELGAAVRRWLHVVLFAGSPLTNEPNDFALFGVALRPFLGVDAAPVDVHFKDAAGGLNQPHFSMREDAADFGRQTGGPWFVVSDDAVFNCDGHVVNDSRA